MFIVLFTTVLLTVITLLLLRSLWLLKKIYFSHKIANMGKYVNSGKFNDAFNLAEAENFEDKKFFLRPIVDIDDKNIRNIVFVNNVNSIISGADNKLFFELSLISEENCYYYFITDNYKIDTNQTLASNIVVSNFPKAFGNDPNHYSFLNLHDLGYPVDTKIKTDDIAMIVFSGKTREMIIAINDNKQTLFYIKYKSKLDMVSLIKKTCLYSHIMQWGIAGFEGSILTKVDNNHVEGGETNVGAN